MCPLTTEQRLKDLAEKLRHKIESHNFEADKPISVTVSIGATLTDSSEAFASTYKRIDNALYEAKSQGRNTVVFVNREFYS